MTESWVVKNNTRGILHLPENNITFLAPNQEKDLCFHTNKTVAELERDKEIIINLAHNNLEEVEKIKYDPVEEKKEALINDLRKDSLDLANQIVQLKEIIVNSQSNDRGESQKQEVDTNAIIEAIKQILPKENNAPTNKNIVYSEDDDEEEKMRQDVIKHMVAKSKTVETNLENFGTEKKIESSPDDNADLLDGIDI